MRFVSFLSSFIAAWRDYRAETNTLLGHRYAVQEVIGEGSYGITYKCIDQTDGSIVAVKQARPSKGAFAKQLLEREARILKKVRHSHIPAFRNFFTEGRNTYLAMSLLSGNTLDDLIFDQGRQYGEADSVRITLQLLELVGYVHRHGIVHLDLRIPNVLIKDEELYLIDFGLAREIGEPSLWHPPQSKFGKEREASRALIAAEDKSDLMDIGHFMLFLLYSSYELDHDDPDHDDPDCPDRPLREQSWQEELNLSEELKTIIERLLQLREPYSDTSQPITDLLAIMSRQR